MVVNGQRRGKEKRGNAFSVEGGWLKVEGQGTVRALKGLRVEAEEPEAGNWGQRSQVGSQGSEVSNRT
jgi:hypothetical protein